MSKLYTLRKALQFYFKAVTPYQLHSPFFFDFANEVALNNRHYYAYDRIDELKLHLARDERIIKITDFGAGSKNSLSNERKVSSILTNSATPHRKGKILFNLARHFKAKHILELGTNLGIGTGYLSGASKYSKVTTIEGCPAIMELAKANLKYIKRDNVHFVLGEFGSCLEKVAKSHSPLDLVFIDGNHSYEATLEYTNILKPFLAENAVIVYDDIFWSKGMNDAWQHVKKDGIFNASIELFDYGIVVKNSKLSVTDLALVPYRWKPWKIGLFAN